MAADIKVSVAEICEVRESGLQAEELLALAASASEQLPRCPKGRIFDPEHVMISSRGNVVITTTPSTSAEPSFVPPEWSRGEFDEAAAAVYCMGAVMRACGAEEAQDVDLFSLVNILTVGMIGTRPTSHRMGQMARNQLRGRDPRSVLLTLYEEIMGDEEANQLPDDMDYDDLDEFDDEVPELNSRLAFSPPVSSSTPGPLIKKAVEVFDDDDEHDLEDHPRRGTSISSSSGHSTQKDTSPFDDEIEEEIIHEQRVPSPIAPPRSPRRSIDAPFLISTPVKASTAEKMDETFIEEHSIHMSFDRNREEEKEEYDSNVELPNSFESPAKSPFGDMIEYHGGTLSGRDPFEEHEPPMKIPPVVFKPFEVEKQPLRHRFSSSSDEIVEARFDDDDISPSTAGASSYFSEIAQERKEQNEPETMIVHPSPKILPPKQALELDDSSRTSSISSSEISHSDSAKRRSSLAELDRLKMETDKLRVQTKAIEEKIEDNRTHVDAVVITEPPRIPPLISKPPESEDEGLETSIEDAFRDARRKSQAEISIVSPIGDSPRLERHNSLLPARVSRRSKRSMRGKRKIRAVPEFYDTAHYQNIRLKAPSSKKKAITLHRIEQTEVWVELLNGQQIEVSCRSDAIARDIFSLVVQHMNINEHIFFGLSIIRDSEHYFLEDHQRLEKFAPSGWKSANRSSQRHQFILYLRFRFYPQLLEFIKTEITMHEMYLQVRRDVLDDWIQPRRENAFELAGLALQAEFGNRPPPAVLDYFDSHHYLPKRFCAHEDANWLRTRLAELHGKHSGIKTNMAEHRYIEICQKLADFGSHFHRVFRNKPSGSVGSSPFDPDTGASLWISIMPRGIAVYEEQAGLREKLDEHLWPDTQTLQFDKKKFVIVAQRNSDRSESVFYTDHHSKSSYFVKFSASQHRFMMKMRQWKTTLRHENTIQAMPDVAVEGRELPHPVRVAWDPAVSTAPTYMHALSPNPLEEASSMFEKVSRPSAAPPAVPRQQLPPEPIEQKPEVLDVSIASHDRSIRSEFNETVSNSLLERFETASDESNGGYIRFEVALQKEQNTGLGLTLVDGNLNGVKGVYVKSVAENGAGMKAGLIVGDRLLAVDGQSLEGGDRHTAVNLVKACGSVVRLEIGRMDGIVRHEKSASRDSRDVVESSRKSNSLDNSLTANAPKGVSRTPPAPRRAANRRVRAVSDFGAIGDTLPSLDGDRSIDLKAISGLHLDDSDEEKGEYRLPQSSMYAFDNHDDDEPGSPRKKEVAPIRDTASPRTNRDIKKKHRYARRSGVIEGLEDLGEEGGSESSEDVIYVSLERNVVGSLGIQLAKSGDSHIVQELHSEPALGHPDIKVGMILISVNGEETTGLTHQEVVRMMRAGGQKVSLGLSKSFHAPENSLTVELKQSSNGTFGLSLAKRMGAEGIFIRMIADGSVCAQEGTLKVGDRLLALDGQSVDGSSPAAILERLKNTNGSVQLTIVRSE